MLTTEILKIRVFPSIQILNIASTSSLQFENNSIIKHEIVPHEEFHQQNVDKPKPFSSVFSSTTSTTSSGREEYQVIKGDILTKTFKFGESDL